jgi:hypothetical protein
MPILRRNQAAQAVLAVLAVQQCPLGPDMGSITAVALQACE